MIEFRVHNNQMLNGRFICQLCKLPHMSLVAIKLDNKRTWLCTQCKRFAKDLPKQEHECMQCVKCTCGKEASK